VGHDFFFRGIRESYRGELTGEHTALEIVMGTT
jgi:hypothetical protein